jgi:hypothetical protein
MGQTRATPHLPTHPKPGGIFQRELLRLQTMPAASDCPAFCANTGATPNKAIANRITGKTNCETKLTSLIWIFFFRADHPAAELFLLDSRKVLRFSYVAITIL